MNTPDIINGAYEASAGFFLLGNCRALYHDKQVRGVSVPATVFFTSWGFWNLYLYSHLGLWLSFTGTFSIVGGNLTWLALAFRYRART